jgi:hypothetical protein
MNATVYAHYTLPGSLAVFEELSRSEETHQNCYTVDTFLILLVFRFSQQ